MLRDDLARAGIEVETAAGVVDFHSLRVTFITNLARGGVHPKVARHSTIELTMQTYTKLDASEQRAGIDALPMIAPAAG